MVVLLDVLTAIQDFMEKGGEVLWLIMVVLALMWTFILERLWYFSRVHPSKVKNAVAAWDARADTTSWYAKRVRDAMVSEMDISANRFIPMLKTLVALCPLLGLLGTVTGMVFVFDVMAVTGTGNPRAMAAGVSRATIPTMAGMVSALSGIFFVSYLERKRVRNYDRLVDALQHH